MPTSGGENLKSYETNLRAFNFKELIGVFSLMTTLSAPDTISDTRPSLARHEPRMPKKQHKSIH